MLLKRFSWDKAAMKSPTQSSLQKNLRREHSWLTAFSCHFFLRNEGGQPRPQLPCVAAVVRPLSRVRPFEAPWTVAQQASLSLTLFQSVPKFMSTESVRLPCAPPIQMSELQQEVLGPEIPVWPEPHLMASLMEYVVEHMPAIQETWVWSLGWEDPLEKEMTVHSNILAWGILWKEEPGGLQSIGSQRVGHDWTTNTYLLLIPLL